MSIPKPQVVRSALAATVLVAACTTAVSSSLATSDPPASAVNHSGENYTLDGKSVPPQAAEGGAACIASADASGGVACFSSAAKLGSAGVDALDGGQLPPGYSAIPPGVDRSSLKRRFTTLESGGSLTPPSQTATAAALQRGPQRHRKVTAHAAEHDLAAISAHQRRS